MKMLHVFKRSPILLLLVLAFFGSSFTRQGFSIQGELVAPNGTTIRLVYDYNDQLVTDSTTVQNHIFKFSGKLPEAVLCTLSTSVNPQIRIFLAENSAMKVSGEVEKLHALKIENSVQQNSYAVGKELLNKPSVRFREQLKAEGKSQKDTSSNAYKSYEKTRDSLVKAFVLLHRDEAAAALVITDQYVTNPNRKKAGVFYSYLSPKGKSTVFGKRIQKFAEADRNLAIGNRAPDFTLNDWNGKAVKLSDFKGKYVFVDFWASWCPPCRAEHPALIKLEKTYKNDIVFVSVSMDAIASSWKKAVETDGLTWLQLNDPKSTNGAVADAYGIKSLPFNCVINPEGKIMATYLRGQKLEDFLASTFKK